MPPKKTAENMAQKENAGGISIKKRKTPKAAVGMSGEAKIKPVYYTTILSPKTESERQAERNAVFNAKVDEAVKRTFSTKGPLSLNVIFEYMIPSELRSIITAAINEVIKAGNGERSISVQVISDSSSTKYGSFEREILFTGEIPEWNCEVNAQDVIERALSHASFQNGTWIFVTARSISPPKYSVQDDVAIGGLTIPLVCALISTVPYGKLESFSKEDAARYMRSVVFHEMGHLFAVPSPLRISIKDKVEEKYGFHCTQYCVMEQTGNIFSIIGRSNFNGLPFWRRTYCKQCEKDLKQSIKEIGVSRKTSK